MKNNQYLIKQIITYLLATSSSLFLFIIFYQLLFKDITLNPYQKNHLYSNSYSVEITPHSTINKCEIVITEKDEDYIKALQSDFPKCKIIEKNNLFQFDLINYISNLFN